MDKPNGGEETATAAEAWVTIKEGFAAAFTSDVGLTLKIEGLPKNAKLDIFALPEKALLTRMGSTQQAFEAMWT